MKDFTFEGADFWSYEETCKAIKKFGMQPEQEPDDHQIQQVQEIIERCLKSYWPEPGELKLKGVYIYREREQPAGAKESYGITHDIGNGQAIIGLSTGLLKYNMPVFHDLVFLHECCHFIEIEHNEKFQDRFNQVEFDYYFYNDIRMDGTGARPKPNRKGWKM